MGIRKGQISKQYIKQDPITVTILDVVNPAHFILRESPGLNASSEAKCFLEAEEAMQKYYESIEPCFFQLPLKDSIIVVFSEKKFYRAKVINILTLSAGHLFRVYLVDYGVERSVPRECIYEIERDFYNHPFQAVDVKLLGMEPVSLLMNPTDLTMSYGPVTNWDPSADIYVSELQKGMCSAYIEVKAVDEECIYGSLFLCYNDNTIKCINDELVSNTFAQFNSSCWDKVHKIEDILENNLNSSLRDEPSASEHENPEQMSSLTSPSKPQPLIQDFTTMFLRSDGKVVAKSSFTIDEVVDSKSEVEKECLTPKVPEIQKTVSSPVSEKVSPDQKALNLNRFQKLQRLHKKTDCSAETPQSSNKNDSSVENNVQAKNAVSDITNNIRENNSEETNGTKFEKTHVAVSPSFDSNNNLDNRSKQSNSVTMVHVASDNKPKEEIKSPVCQQASPGACTRLQMLQESYRKRKSGETSSKIQSVDSTSSSNLGNNSTEVSVNNENCSSHSNLNKREERFVDDRVNNTNKLNVSSDKSESPDRKSSISEDTASKSPLREEITSKASPGACTRLQMLQESYRRRKSGETSSKIQSVDSTSSSNLGNNSTEVSVNRENCSSHSNLNKSEERFVDDRVNSTGKPNVSSDNSQSADRESNISEDKAGKSPLREETKPEVISKNLNSFLKLQQIARIKNMRQSSSSGKSADNVDKQISPTKGCVESEQSPDNLNSEKMQTSIEKSGRPTETSAVEHPNLTDNSPGRSKPDILPPIEESFPAELKKITTNNHSSPVHQNSSDESPKRSASWLSTKSESPRSVSSNGSPTRTLRNFRKSPSPKGKFESGDSDISSADLERSEMLNELLRVSDSDDLLCSISNKKDEFCDQGHVEENYIELSTQLKHSDPKLIEFNEMSLWEKQKIPALLIGVGLTHPALNVEEAKFSKHVMQILKDVEFYGPSCIQSVIWPCLDKNRCMVAVAPPHSGKSVSYVLPLVSSFTEGDLRIPNNNGPSAIILCSSWLKAQAVYDLFYFFLRNKSMNIITLCTSGGHYRNRVVSLINSCDVLIATPHCLLQFLKTNSIKLSQLENLILDDTTALMNKHKKELKNILLSYVHASKTSTSTPQLMLFAERWDKNFHIILDKMMSNPLIFFTSFLESAVFAKVPIFAHVCEPEQKKNTLVGIIKEAGKVVICTTNVEDATEVHHFLRCESLTTFLVNEEMEHYIADEVIRDWKSTRCSTTSHCLVITDKALTNMSISNAACLVHYDIPPESRLQFGNRFSCIAEHFQETKPPCVSHIFVTKSECYYAPQIAEIVRNSGGIPTDDLIELCKQQDEAESSSDLSDLLCPYFKAFGVCKERHCKNRHVVDAEKDKPQVVPSEGDIQGLVTHIIDTSHYYVRLLRYLDPVSHGTVSLVSTYAEIGFQLRDFYSCCPADLKVEKPEVGGIYVLAEENNLFYRIKVLKEFNTDSMVALPSWKILYLDEGWIKSYEKLELYELSPEIKLPAPTAVEVYVCNITTPDSCSDWNPQTSQLVSDLIKGKEIHGKVALCLGKTLWLDPIAVVLRISNTNEFVTLFKLNQKLLECGHVRENKCHLVNLRQVSAGKVSMPQVAKPNIKKENKVAEQTSEINYAFLECNTYEDVYVSSVISPHQLYVQRAKFVECLDNLLDEINELAEKRKLKKVYTPHNGLHCIAPFHEDNRYYRAVITDIVSYTEVQLFYVDYGDMAKVSWNDIYCLPPEFLLLPFQAIECELAGIAPAHGGWTDSSVDNLKTLTRDEAGDMKILQLKAYKKSSSYGGGNHYVIDLWFNDKSISEQLLQAGFGAPTDVPFIQSPPLKSHDPSSDLSSDEEFNLSEKESKEPEEVPSDDDDDELNSDDKDSAALFYNYVAEMVLQSRNLVPKPGVTITEVSSEDEKSNSKVIAPDESTSKKVDDLVKLLPKTTSGSKDARQLESVSTRKPLITWWDTPDQLNVLINLKEVKVYQLVVTDEGFSFNTIIAGIQYSADEKLYDKIYSSDARKYQTFQGVNIVAKKHVPFKWPRLTKEKKKFLHISYDLIHIEDSDSDEKAANAKKQNFRSEYTKDEDSSSTDEDEKYVEPWKDFAQQNRPFSTFD